MKKELDKIKKQIERDWGKKCYKHGRIALGCYGCQIWRAIDVLEQAEDFERIFNEEQKKSPRRVKN